MKLRKLEQKDAPLMLEWMHDKDVTENLQANFASKTIEDCEAFIESSLEDKDNIHMAVVDESDEYMGTVSLKNIKDGTAEFAISMRTKSMGKGYSKYGMAEIIRIALEDMGLSEVYWCVSPDNKRAVRFYDKNGYSRVKGYIDTGMYSKEQSEYYIWYRVTKNQES